jgi:hypothetical protein
MKEMFLHTGYYSQVIYKNKIINYDKYSNQVKANEYFNILSYQIFKQLF